MTRAAEDAAHRHDECCTVAVGTFTARCLNLLAASICMTMRPIGSCTQLDLISVTWLAQIRAMRLCM